MDGIRRILFLVILGAGGAFLLRHFCFEGIVIATASMEPTLPVGRHVFANKLSYLFAKPQRGDIVMFPSPVEKKELVKRVVAVGGDEVAIKDKKVLLNGVEANEPYVQHTRAGEMLVGDNLEVGRVPADSVFVLGDNRDESGDSRDWKDAATGGHIYFIPVKDIKGKVSGVY